MMPRAYTEKGIMIRMHKSTIDLADQDASVVLGGAAYLHDRGTLLSRLKTEKKLRPRQQPLAIRKPVEAAINPSCDRRDIVLISKRIQTPGLPVPTRDIDRQVRVLGHLPP